MLSFFRNNIQGMVIKALMLLLVLTFILWGVGDMLRGGGGEPYLFQVGSEKFTEPMWRQIVRNQLQNLNQAYGQNFTEEDLKKSGYYENLLNQLINRSVLKQEAKRLNVLVSDEMVKYDIASHPAFQDGEGKFSREMFQNTLRKMNLSEESFIANLKDELAVSHISQPFTFSLPSPQLLEQLNIAINSDRVVDLYEVDTKKITLTQKPADQELEAILEQNKDNFSTPEEREVSYFTFSIKDVNPNVEVSDKELEDQYKAKIFLFTTPEKRTIHQLIFKDMAQALEAKKLIDSGEKLASVGQRLKAVNKETLLGTLTREGFDREIAEAIFTIDRGQVSIPIQTPMGMHLFQVTEITPQKTLSFEEAKPQLQTQYKEEKLFERLSALAQKIDNEIANNKTIEEIAKQYNYSLLHAKLNEHSKIKNPQSLIESQTFRAAVFSTDLNTNSMVTPYNEDTFFVVSVKKITPKRVKTKEEVKDELVRFWVDEQKAGVTDKLVADLSSVLNSSQDISPELQKYINIKKLILNKQNVESLPREFMEKIYRLELKNITLPYKYQDKYLLAKLIKLNKPTQEVLDQGKFEVQSSYAQNQGDIYMLEYLTSVRDRYKISINYNLIK